jgi:DNA-binding NtrC family response regulator
MLILLVEDSTGQRELFQECLQLDGHRVEGVATGQAALEALRSTDFELVITDRVLPDVSGLEIAAEVKKMSPQVPVILITGYGDSMETTPEQARNLDLVLGKPLGIRDLREAISTVQARAEQ